MNDDKVTSKAYWKALGQPWRTEPEIDLLLVTPLNRTVSPIDPAFSKLFQSVFNGCLNQEHSPRLSNRRMASRQCSRRL